MLLYARRAVEARRGAGLRAESDGKRAVLTYDTKSHFFRALGLLLEKEPQGAFRAEETPVFRTCGAMFDVSRNAVLKPECFGFFVRRMALMGMNMAMLYMEDVYEVPGEPYFGWMRGRYTARELREMDDYAFGFGIEVVPAVQTLAHLEKVLRWQPYAPLRDTANVLLGGEKGTLALVERMIRAASEPFRSRRIHLGMDEAEGLGDGNYARKNGRRPALDILNDHLRDVLAVCRGLGLEPMIWSDMYLKLLSPTGGYYDTGAAEKPLPAGLAGKMPRDVSLVYWDYYHEDRAVYEALLKKHRRFPNDVIFAGGAWTWGSVSPALGKAFACTNAGLEAAKAAGVEEVFCTLWGDDGAETNYLCSLPVLQLFAEHAYREGTPGNGEVFRRFAACCGADAEDFWELRRLDETPGVEKDNPRCCNPSKHLLYQDVMLGLFDRHAEGLPLESWYAGLAARFAEAEKRSPRYAPLFAHYRALAEVLSGKALLGCKTAKAYREQDRAALSVCAETCGALAKDTERLLGTWETLWLLTYKPFGLEEIEVRLGGLETRLRAAGRRIRSYLAGEVAALPELEEPRLFFDGRAEAGEFPGVSCATWDRIVSAGGNTR